MRRPSGKYNVCNKIPCPKEPVIEPATGRALMLFAHGTSDGAGAEIADRLAAELSSHGLFDEVAALFLVAETAPRRRS